MERARRCLKQFYEPDMDLDDKGAVIEGFGRALRFEPKWAVAQAFDRWEQENTHRPSPGHIVKLARDAKIPLVRELHEREKAAEVYERRDAPDRETATAICERAGFTPQRFEAVRHRPTARSDAELYGEPEKRAPHWTETVDPDGPEMAQLRKARDENQLIREAREAAAAKREGT